MIGHMDKCIDVRGQEYLTTIFTLISKAMGCESPEKAITEFRLMMKEIDLKNPVAGNRDEEIDVLSHSVNPVRLKNNPVNLDERTIYSLYMLIVK
jgi:alcohol dehydrogenase class IV